MRAGLPAPLLDPGRHAVLFEQVDPVLLPAPKRRGVLLLLECLLGEGKPTAKNVALDRVLTGSASVDMMV